jgi:ribonuclease HI
MQPNGMKQRKQVEIYTDGACRGNPGVGGWGAILVYKGVERELSGGEKETTNNRMELTAVIEAFSALREPCKVTLTSDSRYVIDALSLGWAEGWRARGWKKADRSPALNADLWERLLNLIKIHEVTYQWIKGHNEHPYNERCDRLATAFADHLKVENNL